MAQHSYSIDDDIFKQFPGYCRGVVLAFDIKNGDSPSELIVLMREAEESLRQKINKDDIATHPRIASWRDAYRSFGAKPSKYRSSIEAMDRRVVNNNELPSINRIVDIGNIISLRHLVTIGGHAIDLLKGDISLRKAAGNETFTAFGTDTLESPEPGEIIFTEGNTVLTRRWSWRQANHTATQNSTKAIEMNVDGLPPVKLNEVEDICKEVTGMIQTYCGGKLSYKILKEEYSKIELSDPA